MLDKQAYYKRILDAIPDTVFCISRDGKYLDVQGEEGKISREIIGKYLQDVLPEEIAMISQQAIAKTLDTKTLQTYEYQLKTSTGLQNYEARLVVIGTNEVLAIVRNTTQEKKDLLMQSMGQKFAKAFDCSPDPISITTLEEGRFIEVNESFLKLSGYERSEVIGQTAHELSIWIDKNNRSQFIHQLREYGIVRNMEFQFRRKSGEVCISMVSAELFELDDVECLIMIARDITQGKQIQEQLFLSVQRDRLLAKTLAAIRQSLNLDQILQAAVDEVRDFLQTDRVFIGLNNLEAGKILAESVAPKYPSILGCQIQDQAVIKEMKNLLTSVRVRVVNNTEKTTASPKLKAHYKKFQIKATLAVPIMLNGELFGALVAHQCSSSRNWQSIEIDLLEQMSEQLALAIQQAQLYEELAELNANLERQVQERTLELRQKMHEIQEINSMKDVVLHTVSHDLKTSVMGNLMVLNNLRNQELCMSSDICTVPVSTSVIERMIQGNERQLGMINSLLEIHSTEEKGVNLHCESVQLHTLVSGIFQDLEPLLTKHHVITKNLVPDDLPLIMVDKNQLSRVFINLFAYICQRNPPGFNFTIKAIVESQMIKVNIQDNGVGMSKSECANLFNLCVRSPQAGSLTSASLKLYVCRQIIKAHGGEISANPNRRRGLNFTFTLPLDSP